MQKTEENNKTTILINKEGRKREYAKDVKDVEENYGYTEHQTIFKTTKYDKELLETDPGIFDLAKEDIMHDFKLMSKRDTNEE